MPQLVIPAVAAATTTDAATVDAIGYVEYQLLELIEILLLVIFFCCWCFYFLSGV